MKVNEYFGGSVKIILSKKFIDNRGFFSEIYQNYNSFSESISFGSQIHPETKTYKKRTKSHKYECFP